MGLRLEARHGSSYGVASIRPLNAPSFGGHVHFAPAPLLVPGKHHLFGALERPTQIISLSFGPDGVFCWRPRKGQHLARKLRLTKRKFTEFSQWPQLSEHKNSVILSNGDMLVMGAWFQRYLDHRLGAHTDAFALHTGPGRM